ncbi:MAG: type 4a pilus biogenesis protein PilO [Acidobacteria bacterium]|nr:type 4a pilus biogenesis protein PilO [Acidobacteriota bacterium]
MALEFSINKLPQRVQFLLFTLVVLGFCSIFYVYYIKPIRSEVDQLQSEIQALRIDVQRGQIVQARLPEFKEEIRRQQEKLATLREILPEEKETAEVIRKIQELAVASNLQIRAFTPQKTTRNDFYEDWPIVISLEGNYDNLARFFESVGAFTRIINVDNISITGIENNPARNRTLSAVCRATTFVFLESAEIS